MSSHATSTTTPTPSTTGCTTAPRCRSCWRHRRSQPIREEANELRRQAAEQIATDAPAVWVSLFHDLVVTRSGVTGLPEFDLQARFDASDLQVTG